MNSHKMLKRLGFKKTIKNTPKGKEKVFKKVINLIGVKIGINVSYTD